MIGISNCLSMSGDRCNSSKENHKLCDHVWSNIANIWIHHNCRSLLCLQLSSPVNAMWRHFQIRWPSWAALLFLRCIGWVSCGSQSDTEVFATRSTSFGCRELKLGYQWITVMNMRRDEHINPHFARSTHHAGVVSFLPCKPHTWRVRLESSASQQFKGNKFPET